jgi:isoquinoline 1-oxidoreductase subunit beta
MKTHSTSQENTTAESQELIPCLAYDFGVSRRGFVHVLGAGLLIAAAPATSLAQQNRGRGGGQRQNVGARIHVGQDGRITLLTGKIEMGQGARAELTQAAAEELRVSPDQIQAIMGDTSLVPDDGVTAGSRTTPGTVPVVRQGAAAARQLLVELACKRWNVDKTAVEVRAGKVIHSGSQREFSYADLAKTEEVDKNFEQAVPSGIVITPITEWKVMGTSFPRPNRRDLVTGAHKYPSDIIRPGMLYGKVLRPPSYGAKLMDIDLAPAKALPGVTVVREDQFVGVTAPTTFQARQALSALTITAKWEPSPHPSSQEIFDYLRQHAQGGVPQNPFQDELAKAHQKLRQTFHLPYVQHAPLETRVAVAEWNDGTLTVWTCTQNPFGYHGELARAFRLANDRVRVVVPDFGSGFGGKHTGEAAIEAARLARAAQRPVCLKWTREEEFTWAYYRPAAVIDVEASLDDQGRLTSWQFININAGGAGVETPYRAGQSRSRSVGSESPLRQGSYRTLAATGNNWARECFMDELAKAAGKDPLEFRLAHLENPRLRAVLETAARRFNWTEQVKRKEPNVGVGLACGTEKGSFVAACVEIFVDRAQAKIVVRRVCEVFECGAVVNPDNLISQMQGCIIMGLGPALREQMEFAEGKMLNASFRKYRVPRFSDVPELDLHILNRNDLSPLGGGETPIIALAPAMANALFQVTGKRLYRMPFQVV